MNAISIHPCLVKRIISNSNPDVLYFVKKNGLTTFSQITEENLRLLHRENAEMFYNVVRILGFLGVRYTGKLEPYSSLNLNQGPFLSYDGTDPADTEVVFTYKTERFLSSFLTGFGLRTAADFSFLHLPTLEYHLEKLNLPFWYESLMEELQEQHFRIVEKLVDIIEGNDQTTVIASDSFTTSAGSSTLMEPGMVSAPSAKPVWETEITSKTVHFDDMAIKIPPGMLSCKVETVFSSSVLRNINCLLADGLTTYGQLPERLADYFRAKPQIGPGKINKFKLELLAEIEGNGDASPHTTTTDNLAPAVQPEKHVHVPALLFDIRVDLFVTVITKQTSYPDVAERLHHLGIQTWGELASFTKTELLERLWKKGTRMKSLLHVFEVLEINLDGEETDTPLPVLWERFCSDLSAIAENRNCHPEMLEANVWDILYKRVNKGPLGREWTLQEIADEKGITRERIRQIENRGFEQLMFRHMPMVFTLYESVSGKYNLVAIEEILNSPIELSEAEEVVLANIIKKCDIGIVYSTEYHAFLVGEQARIQEEIGVFVAYLFSERRWYHPIRLREKIKDYFKKNPTSHLSPTFVEETVIPSRFLMYESIYFAADGSKKDLTWAVFEAYFPDGLAIIKDSQRFTDKMLAIYPDKFAGSYDRSIYASLLRNEEDVLIWDNGYYTPRSSVKVKFEDIEPMMAWTVQLLKDSNAPQIRLTRTLWHFQKELANIGITNAYSLYTCFRLHGQEFFDFVKAPRICLKGGLEAARQPLTQMFQEYMKAQKRKVSRREMLDLFKDQLGWQTYHIEQRMGDQIIRAGYEEYIHIENLQVNEEGLESVKNWLVRKLESVGSVVSIKIVNRAVMKLAGVDSYHILYYLLDREYPEVFSFYIFPKLGLFDPAEEELASTRRSRMALLENHMLSGERVFYRSELESYFQSIGWNNLVYNSDKLITYESKNDMALAFVHRDTIGITEEKQAAFLSLIDEAFDTLQGQGQECLDMDAFIHGTGVESRLPKLDHDITWTQVLMISLLKTEERFEILGITGRVVIRDDNPTGIANEQDLINHVLIKEFGGATSIGKMEKRLQELNLITRNMSKMYFNDGADEDVPYVTTPSLEIMTQELYRLQMKG